jgi:hypothetical protein
VAVEKRFIFLSLEFALQEFGLLYDEKTREHPRRKEHSYMLIRFKSTTLSAKRLSTNDVSTEN